MRPLAPLSLLLALVQPAQLHAQQFTAAEAPDAPTWYKPTDVRPETYTGVVKRSLYIIAKDGTRLAADVYLPAGVPSNKRLPTVLQQTRYYRSAALVSDPGGSCAEIPAQHAFFVKRGYAVVVVDVRGSGASFGSRSAEFSAAEIADGAAVLDWIAAQRWSDGRVGATGGSYVGTTAEFLTRLHHPALKAVAPVSVGYDFYSDLDFPGGSRQSLFIDNWSAINSALDGGAPSQSKQPFTMRLAGPCKVDADLDGKMLQAAVAEHASNKISAVGLRDVASRDDPWVGLGVADWQSPYRYQKSIDASGVPLLALVGWADAGYSSGGINRMLNTRSSGQRLIIGASNHGMGFFAAPGVTKPMPSAFARNEEVLRFFDHYVAGLANGYEREARVRWFTTGSNRWNEAQSWPTTGRTVRYVFGEQRTMDVRSGPAANATFTPTGDAATGNLSRWNTSLGGFPVIYSDRAAIDGGLLTFTSEPLSAPATVTGAPVVTLKVANAAKDADYFVYLEEVTADGHSRYVTEGVLRASQGKPGPAGYRTYTAATHSFLRRDVRSDTAGMPMVLSIPLQPISHQFASGTRLRIAIAGSDVAHFSSPPLEGQRWTVKIGKGGSALQLPISR